MYALQFIYHLTARTLERRGSDEARFIAFLIVSLLVHPPVKAVIDLLAGAGSFTSAIERVESTFYTRVSLSFYVATAMTAFIVWACFDRNRNRIGGRFTWVDDSAAAFGMRYAWIALAVICAILLRVLSDRSGWLCLAVFVGTLLPLSHALTARLRRGPGGGDP